MDFYDIIYEIKKAFPDVVPQKEESYYEYSLKQDDVSFQVQIPKFADEDDYNMDVYFICEIIIPDLIARVQTNVHLSKIQIPSDSQSGVFSFKIKSKDSLLRFISILKDLKTSNSDEINNVIFSNSCMLSIMKKDFIQMISDVKLYYLYASSLKCVIIVDSLKSKFLSDKIMIMMISSVLKKSVYKFKKVELKQTHYHTAKSEQIPITEIIIYGE